MGLPPHRRPEPYAFTTQNSGSGCHFFKEERRMTMERVIVTRPFVGICHMQVCAVEDATDEEILEVCNIENPSGTTNGWNTVCHTDHDFFGKTAPVKCAEYPNRTHFLVSC